MQRPRVKAAKPKKTLSKVKLVLVKWEDAAHQADESEPIGTLLAWTVGFLMYQNEKETAVCRDVFEDGSKQEIIAIPAGMVRHVRSLATIPITSE